MQGPSKQRSNPNPLANAEISMSRQLMAYLVGIVLLALASIVIARQVQQVESLQARVATLEGRVADIGRLKLVPADSGK